VRQVVRGKKIGFRRIIKNVVAGVDAGMKMRIDETRRDQTAARIDCFVNRLGIILSDKLDEIAVEDHDTILDQLMRLTIESDNPATLDQCFHRSPLFKPSIPGGCETYGSFWSAIRKP
jgi:hypothetical protein